MRVVSDPDQHVMGPGVPSVGVPHRMSVPRSTSSHVRTLYSSRPWPMPCVDKSPLTIPKSGSARPVTTGETDQGKYPAVRLSARLFLRSRWTPERPRTNSGRARAGAFC
jgi:hypothetical protein